MRPAQLLIAVSESVVHIQIVGRANFALSVDFKTVLNELYTRGFRHFVLDLTPCLIMDSTFLGVLAGFTLKARSVAEPPPKLVVQLLNPNPRVADLFENLGIAPHFQVVQQVELPKAYQEAGATQPTKEQLSQASLEAHQSLMAMNPANVPRFKDVVEFLKQDLAKVGPGAAS